MQEKIVVMADSCCDIGRDFSLHILLGLFLERFGARALLIAIGKQCIEQGRGEHDDQDRHNKLCQETCTSHEMKFSSRISNIEKDIFRNFHSS